MRIHEYQGKEILKRFSIKVPTGKVISEMDEIGTVFNQFNKYPLIVKAQVHAGGRGESGGVRKAENNKDLKKIVAQMLGSRLVTNQTGEEGKLIRLLLVEEEVDILKEFYIGILVDRNYQKILIMVSEDGGKNIEKAQECNPNSIKKLFIDPSEKIEIEDLKALANSIKIPINSIDKFCLLSRNLLKAFLEFDATLAEINPLCLTKSGDFVALDSKWNFDSNAIYRQQKILKLRDYSEEDPLELESSKANISYIKLHGDIACMVNGAGLAMATMDIIKLYGGSAANFLDVGGGATIEKVCRGFEIMSLHPNVKVGFINIFGGIMRCDFVAQGVTNGLKKIKSNLPLVVRLKGFKEIEAKKILKESGFEIKIIDDFDLAAKSAISLSKKPFNLS